MTEELNLAAGLLRREKLTCVLIRGDTVLRSTERGIAPLLKLVESGTDVRGFSAADKVVGKATAFLYCLLGVKEIYAPVISTAALEVLNRAGISVTFDVETGMILNRRKTGGCPMETAVRGIDDLPAALAAIRETYQKMQ